MTPLDLGPRACRRCRQSKPWKSFTTDSRGQTIAGNASKWCLDCRLKLSAHWKKVNAVRRLSKTATALDTLANLLRLADQTGMAFATATRAKSERAWAIYYRKRKQLRDAELSYRSKYAKSG